LLLGVVDFELFTLAAIFGFQDCLDQQLAGQLISRY
jgi:hypothetical protein